ncbi:MAG: DUF1571 domain-containing protein [Flavobacteriales bacterium]|nr:DUF1571 domain-containing protein [Flavobacteriales bacterium]
MRGKLIYILLFVISSAVAQDARSILQEMNKQISQIKRVSYEFYNQERIDGKLLEARQLVVMQNSPLSIYALMQGPKKGSEILFKKGVNGDQVLFSPNGNFPYVNMNLDPLGSTIRDNNHHTIFELGYGHFKTILSKSLIEDDVKCKVVNETIFDGHEVYVITVDMPYEVNTIKNLGSQKVREYAQLNGLNEYKIMELNDLDFGEVLTVGKSYRLPNHYAKTIEIVVGKALHLPLSIKVYDERGLYEKYVFKNVKINEKVDAEKLNVKNLGKA